MAQTVSRKKKIGILQRHCTKICSNENHFCVDFFPAKRKPNHV